MLLQPVNQGRCMLLQPVIQGCMLLQPVIQGRCMKAIIQLLLIGSESSQATMQMMQRLLNGSDSSLRVLQAGSEGSLWVVLMLVAVLLVVGPKGSQAAMQMGRRQMKQRLQRQLRPY